MTDENRTGAPQTPQRNDLAGEYALGLLEGDERTSFEAQLNESAQLRSEVARWQEHFAALGMDLDEVAPPVSVLGNIKRELWGENRLPWRRRIRIWEYALGGIAAALVANAVYNVGAFSANPAPNLRAQIESQENRIQIALALSPDSSILRIERAGPAAAQGRAYQLWAKLGDADPVSLGVLPAAPVTALRLNEAQAALIRVGAVIALSDEPVGGSPTGARTGAVLGVGLVEVLTNL
jgi:anti-sigma-K factor RskA